ncbi:MAG TPA: hypothetical protein VEH04_00140 [Verrucomicrobiae bacterium]|nr:hypothetical protein [Verrucomicrobiae bacterium]
MKSTILLAFAVMAGISAHAAENADAAKVTAAISKLEAAPNYSWTTTTKLPNSPFEPGPVEARTEKGGYTLIRQDVGDNTMEVAFKGTNIVMKQDGDWRLPGELEGFPAMMAGWIVRNGTAAREATNMLAKARELKAEGDVLTSDYTSEGATALLHFGRETGAPAPKDAKGSIKFWLKDGALTKFESHLKGLVSFGGDEQDFEMTRTFDIKAVGTTKVEVPEAALKKLGAKPATEQNAETK